MNKQPGSALLITVIAMIGLIVAVVGVAGIAYFSAASNGNKMEKNLEAVYDNSRSILAQYGLKIAEAAQVPTMARDDLLKIVEAQMQGRYGNDGNKSVFAFIQEQNPSLDGAIYQKLMQMIEAGRNEFQNSQTRMVEVRRAYETALGGPWSGFWLRIAGFPKIDLEKYKIVSTDRADTAFQTGKDTPMQLR